ncbi:MAG: glucose-6-phosphate isomerase [Myxococcales bacterium]|nr:glucose-6-phosphate isomerase [Myxococcales bacterium]
MSTPPPATLLPLWRANDLGVVLDLTHVGRPLGGVDRFPAAHAAMLALEAGAIANPDEGRQVGHYWLRAPDLAPEALQPVIRQALADCQALTLAVHRERVDAADPESDLRFRDLLVLGIGGSALGPQFIADALGEPDDRMRVHFLDNTDPDGMARVLGGLDLEQTLVLCISKSGGTAETRNALIETQAAYTRAEVDFSSRAIAVSGEGSRLWTTAAGWRARVPMWDWVGGRTSICSGVGLLPMMLQGIDAVELLAGAGEMDVHTRRPELDQNPAGQLALAWLALTDGRARRAMVVLPYRDRLVLFSKYLQQLVMESLGKKLDLQGQLVNQGLTVFGNKGSTDQHAYVQQLRDGPDDHFVTFVAVEDDGYAGQEDVEPGVVSGDYLQGLWMGTRRALTEAGHASITISLPTVDARRIGALIALYERAVGYYATLVGINAYHQPGVEAGKQAAAAVLSLAASLAGAVTDQGQTAGEIASRVGADPAEAWHILRRLSTNERGVRCSDGAAPLSDRFSRRAPG